MGPSRYAVLAAAALCVITLDQLTKEMALSGLADGPVDLITGVLTLRLTFNSGGAFGLLQGLPGFFLVATLVVVVAILMWVRRIEDVRWMVPLGMVLGGGVGNVIDRVVRETGGVVDFIDLHWWPVFNLADASIVMGVGLILLLSTRPGRPAEQGVGSVHG
jgi:signal peptidase II